MPRKKLPLFESNGKAVCYLRVSTGEQALSGLGLMSQGETCAARVKQLGLKFLEMHHDYVNPPRDGHFVDAGKSAQKTRFENRAAGCALMDWLEPGTTLVVARLDRAWRNVVDFIETADKLSSMGVRLVVCKPDIDMGTAIGRAFAQILAVIAEWESNRKGERIRDALAAKKDRQSLVKAIPAEIMENLPSEWRPSRIERDSSVTDHIPGRIFTYIRCSHRDSADSGNGLLVQAAAANAFAESLVARNPLLTIGDVFTDLAVSATDYDLRERRSGKKLWEELKSGDHMVCSTLDRGFRSAQDMANSLRELTTRGVIVHFVGEGISTDEPSGRLMAVIAVTFAQQEAELASDRSKEARAQLALQGKYVGGTAPPFWKLVEHCGTKRLVLHKKKIVGYRLVHFLRHVCGLSMDDALTRAEQLWADRERRPVIPLTGLMKCTVASSLLPRTYPRDMTGRAFPMYTRRQYNLATRHYDAAMTVYRKQVAMLRREKDAA